MPERPVEVVFLGVEDAGCGQNDACREYDGQMERASCTGEGGIAVVPAYVELFHDAICCVVSPFGCFLAEVVLTHAKATGGEWA